MAHAKVLRIDDQVLIGGCNLDDLSLFRNDELDLLFADPAVAELTERSIFDELVAMSTPAVAPDRPARPGLERGDGPGLATPVGTARMGGGRHVQRCARWVDGRA